MITKKSYCDTCAVQVAAERKIQTEHAAKNIQAWLSPTGELVERPVPKLRVHPETIFQFDLDYRAITPLRSTDSCGKLLDLLLGVVFARPAYIQPEDIYRYAALIEAFQTFRDEKIAIRSHEAGDCAAEQPITSLRWLLEDWIQSYFPDPSHRLMPSFALDAACFIEAHAFGHSEYEPCLWRIPAFLEDSDRWMRTSPIRNNSRLKREISLYLGDQQQVLARVPPGHSVVDGAGDVILPTGTEFVFWLKRCHLSTSPYDQIYLGENKAGRPEFDLAADFKFVGGIIRRGGVCDISTGIETLLPELAGVADLNDEKIRTWGIEAFIPARWFFAILTRQDWRGPFEALPLQWTKTEKES